MPTVTLMQHAKCNADGIIQMTARVPDAAGGLRNVPLANPSGGPIAFKCTNPLAALSGAREVEITYDANHGSSHETLKVSSVIS